MRMRSICSLIILLFVFNSAFGQKEPRPETKVGIQLYREGKLTEAIEHLKRIVGSDKKDYDAWLYLGAAYLQNDQEREALKAFRNSSGGRHIRYRRPLLEKTLESRPLVIFNQPTVYLSQPQRASRIRGTVTLAIEFRHDGRLGFIFPVHPLPDGLTELSISAARGFNFQPAHDGGKPVTTVTLYDFNMNEQ
jgi:tetratricopeptide (TPR) repeat protein